MLFMDFITQMPRRFKLSKLSKLGQWVSPGLGNVIREYIKKLQIEERKDSRIWGGKLPALGLL